MNHMADTSLYEDISHQTNTVPYSIHCTEASLDYEPVLYLHWHNEMEFFLLKQGDILFQIEEQTYELHAGDGVFIPPGLLHHANNAGVIPPIFYAFVLSPELIFSSMDSHPYNTYVLPILHNNLSFTTKLTKDTFWQQDILSCLHDIFTGSDSGELYIRGLSLLIWNQLFHNHINRNLVKKTKHSQFDQLSMAINYIQEHYSEPISLRELANCTHLSEGQFCRSFKELTGMTPFHYLIRYRILQSCTALLQTDNRITDIALSCGFNNISYYNRSFLKLMNMTPGEYRKSQINNCKFTECPL